MRFGLDAFPHRGKTFSRLYRENPVKRSEFIFQLQQELRKHRFETFVNEPLSVAEGGRGIVAPGCTLCRVRMNTTTAFLEHLVFEVLPGVVEKILGTS
jgi:hypothetical protein